MVVGVDVSDACWLVWYNMRCLGQEKRRSRSNGTEASPFLYPRPTIESCSHREQWNGLRYIA